MAVANGDVNLQATIWGWIVHARYTIAPIDRPDGTSRLQDPPIYGDDHTIPLRSSTLIARQSPTSQQRRNAHLCAWEEQRPNNNSAAVSGGLCGLGFFKSRASVIHSMTIIVAWCNTQTPCRSGILSHPASVRKETPAHTTPHPSSLVMQSHHRIISISCIQPERAPAKENSTPALHREQTT